MTEHNPWFPSSWRSFPALQIPPYPDPAVLEAELSRLRTLPPLVFPGEIDRLRSQLVQAEEGRGFFLQGGDCAERFMDCREEVILNKFKILLQMSVVLTYSLKTPVIKVGRLAGQYGKPRSKAFENTPTGEIHSYFGDNVNSFTPEKISRIPDPQRLSQGYFHAAATLNWLRSMINGGFTDLHHPQTWDLEAIAPSPRSGLYREMTSRILEAIGFMESFGASRREVLDSTDFWVSHEALHLPYEESLVRKATLPGEPDRWYGTSAHFLWLGERTRALDHAHVEFLRGLENPLGIKLGPKATFQEVQALSRTFNPDNRKGKLVFITRMGAEKAYQCLVPLLEEVRAAGLAGLWITDPMHGNTVTTAEGTKTRSFDALVAEMEQTALAHRRAGTRLGGVHFELTGEDVTECLGGPSGLTETDLSRRYETWCDPRLNYAQSLELAFRLKEILEPAR